MNKCYRPVVRSIAKTTALTLSVTLSLLSGSVLAFEKTSCKPNTLGLKSAWLDSNKQAIDLGEKLRIESLNTLIVEAENILKAKQLNIIDKTQLPPSGDKQDYMSIGPYWWPDPKKADGLPWIRKDGKANPLAYAQTSDKARLNAMGSNLEALALAYYFTDDRRFATKAASILDNWLVNPNTRMNPHLKYGQAIPGITEGRSVGIIDARHFVRVLDAITLIKCSDVLSEKQHEVISNWFGSMLNWLMTSEIGIGERNAKNNHGTHYDTIAISMALFLNQEDTARRLIELTKKRIVKQIKPNGAQPHELKRTRPYHYSVFNLEALYRTATLAENLNVDLWNYPSKDDARLRTALNFLIARPTSKDWQGSQEKTLKTSMLNSYLRRASLVYPSNNYKGQLSYDKIEASGFSCLLLFPPQTDVVVKQSSASTKPKQYQRCAF